MGDISEKIGIVLNPNAGFFRTKKGTEEFHRLTGRWNGDKGRLKEKYGERIVVEHREKAEQVQYAVDNLIENNVSLVISIGGDGTQGNLHTNFARRLWIRNQKKLEEICRKDEKASTEKKSMPDFLKRINTATGEKLPYFYNVKGGTVHVCSSMLGFTRSIERVIDNALLAIEKGEGMRSFRRAYVPSIIGYSAEEPDNPSRMEIMLEYADAAIRRFFDEYYKDKGPGKPNMKTAYSIIAKAAASVPLIPPLPLLPDGFIYKLGRKIQSSVSIDGRTLPIHQRTILVASTIDGNLYGFRPFRKARRNFEDFERHYLPGEEEQMPEQPAEGDFHVLTGDFMPWRAVPAIPHVLLGKDPQVKGLYDTLAKEVIISQQSDIKYIADGTRKDEGKKLVLTSGFEIGMPYLHERPILK